MHLTRRTEYLLNGSQILAMVTKTGGITAGIGVLAIGAVSAVGNFANQVWNNYDENREQSPKNSNSDKEISLQYIKKSIVEVNFAEVANSAIIGMAFAPLSYGTNKLLNTAFSNLDNSFTNRAGEF